MNELVGRYPISTGQWQAEGPTAWCQHQLPANSKSFASGRKVGRHSFLKSSNKMREREGELLQLLLLQHIVRSKAVWCWLTWSKLTFYIFKIHKKNNIKSICYIHTITWTWICFIYGCSNFFSQLKTRGINFFFGCTAWHTLQPILADVLDRNNFLSNLSSIVPHIRMVWGKKKMISTKWNIQLGNQWPDYEKKLL